MSMLMFVSCSAGPLREDKALRDKVWKEIVEVLKAQEPMIKDLVRV
jgi:hypothetical protein